MLITENKYFSRKNIPVFEKMVYLFTGGDQIYIIKKTHAGFFFSMYNNQILLYGYIMFHYKLSVTVIFLEY